MSVQEVGCGVRKRTPIRFHLSQLAKFSVQPPFNLPSLPKAPNPWTKFGLTAGFAEWVGFRIVMVGVGGVGVVDLCVFCVFGNTGMCRGAAQELKVLRGDCQDFWPVNDGMVPM
jgi:hypothetical protein